MPTLLFTSNARSQYIQDVLNILSVPNGTLYHFRYDEKWVSIEQQSLRTQKGQEVLVVFADTHFQDGEERRPKDKSDYKFYSIRCGVLKDTYKEGTIVHLYFELGDFVSWNPNRVLEIVDVDNTSEQQDHSTNKLLNIPNPSTDCFLAIFDGQIHLGSSADNPQRWESIVTVLEQIPDFQRAVFYRIAALRRFKRPYMVYIERILNSKAKEFDLIALKSQILPNKSGYALESGRIYSLELTFFRPGNGKDIDGAVIKPAIDDTFFAFNPENIDVGFRYEQHTISLVPKVVNQDVYTRLVVSIDTKSQKNNHVYSAPKIDFLIKLTYPRIRMLTSFIVLFLAQLLTIAPSLENILKSIQFLSTDIIDGIVTLGPVAGPILTTVILFVLFRRLPGVSK